MARKVHKKEARKGKQSVRQAELDLVFSTITAYEEMLGIPAPPKEKIEQMIRAISHYNQIMDAQNKPEKKILEGDFILGLMLKMGLVAMFGIPVLKKWLPIDLAEKKEKKSKVRVNVEGKSMVD